MVVISLPAGYCFGSCEPPGFERSRRSKPPQVTHTKRELSPPPCSDTVVC